MVSRPEVSVILPTMDEEYVFRLIKDMRRVLGRKAEIIVVDKSSTAYFNKLKKTGARILRQKDRGVENAIMLGLRNANGSILASVDADGTHDISGIGKGVAMIRNGSADFVIGNRLNGLEKGSMGFNIRLGNAILSRLYSRLYRARVHDVLSGLFVMRRDAFEEIRSVDPYRAGIAFFAIELARRGYRIGEVDIRYYRRRYGESKLANSKFAYGLGVASHLVRQIRDYSPLLIFGGAGIILVIAGIGLGIAVLVNFIGTGVFGGIGRALLAFLLVVVGFLLIIAGFIIDLLLEIERHVSKPR